MAEFKEMVSVIRDGQSRPVTGVDEEGKLYSFCATHRISKHVREHYENCSPERKFGFYIERCTDTITVFELQ